MNDKLKKLPTNIESFDKILDGGIRCHNDFGLYGLILGASGTGKSTLGLQMCCRFLAPRKDETLNRHRNSIFITHKPPEIIKNKIKNEDGFHYFRLKSESNEPVPFEIKTDRKDFNDLLKDNEEPKIFILQLPFDFKEQELLLINVFDRACQQDTRDLENTEHDYDKSRILICIDNSNIIHDASLYKSIQLRNNSDKESIKNEIIHEGRLEDPNFFRKLHQGIAQRKLHTFFIYEEQNPSEENDHYNVLIRPDVYAADFVIRMGIKTYPIGYRERYIQVVKAKNQFYYRGRHHCSIVGAGAGGRKNEEERGIVIYPSIPMQLRLEANQREKNKEKQQENQDNVNIFELGIENIDEEIKKDLKGKIEKELKVKKNGYIIKGSTNVLVADLDSKATEIALHFAFQENIKNLYTFYISFYHNENILNEIAGRYFKLKRKKFKDKYEFHYFPPEYISEHKLMRDINVILNSQKNNEKVICVVLDNVFELKCKYPLITDASHFLAALVETFSSRGITTYIVDTVEVGETRNPIELSDVAGLADNVFLLRHVEFQSKPHRVFSILKLAGNKTPDTLWDLDEEKDSERTKIIAKDTFALYKNVLTGNPEPIQFIFTIFQDQEDSPFSHYLKAQITAIKQHFGEENIRVNFYGSEEYSRVQDLLLMAGLQPQLGCHILALEEFWLKEMIKKEILVDLNPYLEQEGKEEWNEKRKQYVSASHDIILSETYKEGRKDAITELYGLPARNNYGILCFNHSRVKRILEENKISINNVKEWLDNLYNENITWDTLLTLKKYALIYFRKEKAHFDSEEKASLNSKIKKENDNKDKDNDNDIKTFFTFCMDQIESCVCMLLEIASSYEEDNEFIDKDGIMHIKKLPVKALDTLFKLLDVEDIEQIASGKFRSSKNEPIALFSRQWMSTLGCLKNRKSTVEEIKETSKPTQNTQEDRKIKTTIKEVEVRKIIKPIPYFQNCEPYPLPIGDKKEEPTPVSGSWYLGLLKNSIAIKEGVKIMKQMISFKDEIYKLNNYIGFPVSVEFYQTKDSYMEIPYKEQFVKITKTKSDYLQNPKEYYETFKKQIITKKYPIYRVWIKDYKKISPILWRLMISAAKMNLKKTGQLPDDDYIKEYEKIRDIAANEYKNIQDLEIENVERSIPR